MDKQGHRFIAGLRPGSSSRRLSSGNAVDLPSRCNLSDGPGYGGRSSSTNPFTPDLLIFDNKGNLVSGPIGKPSTGGNTFQPDGPAIGLAFQKGLAGGTLFSTDSNQQTDSGAGPTNSSRIVTVNLETGAVNSFIPALPTGDHPTEQVVIKDGWIYWSQGSATNSAVVGRDNGGGKGQQEISCQDVTLSTNTFDSGGGVMTSGYSAFGVQRPRAVVPAFESANYKGVCTGAILRARIDAKNPSSTIQPFSWGYRNPFAIRFAPKDHALSGGLLVGENGEDERGSRPTNSAPDRLQLGGDRNTAESGIGRKAAPDPASAAGRTGCAGGTVDPAWLRSSAPPTRALGG